MKTTKKLISLLLTLMLLMTSVCFTAFADEAATEDTTTTDVITVDGLDYLSDQSVGVTAGEDNVSIAKVTTDAANNVFDNYITYKVTAPRSGEYFLDLTYYVGGAAWIYVVNETTNVLQGNVLLTGKPGTTEELGYRDDKIQKTDPTQANKFPIFLKKGENILKIGFGQNMKIYEMRFTPLFDVPVYHFFGAQATYRLREHETGVSTETIVTLPHKRIAGTTLWGAGFSTTDPNKTSTTVTQTTLYYDFDIDEPGTYELYIYRANGNNGNQWIDTIKNDTENIKILHTNIPILVKWKSETAIL